MDYKVKKIILSPELARQKIRAWCAYQERSHYETKKKLFEMGVDENTADGILAELISENYVNEERFARAFAGGKFRIKQWGRAKIKQELKKHKVSDYCINKALQELDETDYLAAIAKLIEKKIKTVKGKTASQKYYSLYGYLVTRGFDGDLIKQQLKAHQIQAEDEFRSEE